MEQGPPTVGLIKRTLFKQGRLSLGDDERWIYLTEDTLDTMNRVNITAFHKALTSEWGKTSVYWRRISQRSTSAYQEKLKRSTVPRGNSRLSFLCFCAWIRGKGSTCHASLGVG